MNRPFSLSKEQWDSISLDLLEELMNPIKKAEVAALVMDGTSAVLCLIQSAMTKTIANIEKGTSSAKNKQVRDIQVYYHYLRLNFSSLGW
jgi:protein pelota